MLNRKKTIQNSLFLFIAKRSLSLCLLVCISGCSQGGGGSGSSESFSLGDGDYVITERHDAHPFILKHDIRMVSIEGDKIHYYKGVIADYNKNPNGESIQSGISPEMIFNYATYQMGNYKDLGAGLISVDIEFLGSNCIDETVNVFNFIIPMELKDGKLKGTITIQKNSEHLIWDKKDTLIFVTRSERNDLGKSYQQYAGDCEI